MEHEELDYIDPELERLRYLAIRYCIDVLEANEWVDLESVGTLAPLIAVLLDSES